MTGKLTRQDVQDILAILENSSFDELKIETGDFKISLRRAGAEGLAPAPVTSEIAKPPPAAAAHFSNARPASHPPPGLVDIPAPMLGVFFHAPKPGADAFVQAGTTIKADSIVGIIEVMKLMNTVPAGIAGEVVEMLAPDGKFVEFGQALMRVKPA